MILQNKQLLLFIVKIRKNLYIGIIIYIINYSAINPIVNLVINNSLNI